MEKRKMWMWGPAKSEKVNPSDSVKKEVKEKCDDFIEKVLKPEHIKPPPKDNQFNYLADIYGKWYRSYFYFCSVYNSPAPNAISPSYDNKFARMEYVGDDKFNLSYMRHTGQWNELFQELTLEECLENMQELPHFMP